MSAARRTKPFAICLSLLMASCATAPPSIPSFSEDLLQVRNQQKAEDCAQLKPTPVSVWIEPIVRAIPEDHLAQSDEQRALIAWMNHDAKEAENYLTYCKET